MKRIYLNDEEQAIMDSLKKYTREQKIKILQNSTAAETEVNNRRTLGSLLLKLQAAQPS